MNLNLGILAHVDAGKTSLTEQLLFTAGVIDKIGRVDKGNTQTDSLALERQRGITIKSAVVSFVVDDITINLIDTPGHPDFIAEVERVLNVLDGVILVISAVEGVQAQTRVLMRTLQRLKLPTLLFVNKIDRVGAQFERLLATISEKLSPAIIPMGWVNMPGSHEADFIRYTHSDTHFSSKLINLLADQNDDLMMTYINDEASLSYEHLCHELEKQTRQARVHPIFFGSAMTGAGISAVIEGIISYLPAKKANDDAQTSGIIFKVERGSAGEKIAYIRLFSGTLQVRDKLSFGQGHDGKVTSIKVFQQGALLQRSILKAGQIGKLWGLGDVEIGHVIGSNQPIEATRHFAPPTLETSIIASSDSEKTALFVALTQLAEQDPLINLRQDDSQQELFLSLYGEVQKEVIQATLENDYDLEVHFRETTPICVERPVGTGSAIEILGKSPNPFLASIGLRIEPAPSNTGIAFQMEADVKSMPLFIFDSVENFQQALERTVQETLRQGLYGWQVTDCKITLTHSGYVSPSSSPADFRKLLPLVLMNALQKAETQVCEPLQQFHLEIPVNTVGPILATLARLDATIHGQEMQVSTSTLEGEIPVAKVHELLQRLPGLTRGEGVLETTFSRFEAIQDAFPTRRLSEYHPINRKAYLKHLG